MKNLCILNKGGIQASGMTHPDLELVDTQFDVFTDSISLLLGSRELALYEVQQIDKLGNKSLLASIPSQLNDKLLSFAHFTDTKQLILVFEKGDIILGTYSDSNNPDPDSTSIEIAGSIDCGLKAAQWSADEECLVLVTMENNLVLLSRLLEPITEQFINPSDLQINHQVSLGWGSEETQFKGRGAKQLERERTALKNSGMNIDSDNAILRDPTIKDFQNGKLSNFDDNLTKISWRGDCMFFSISMIEQPSPDNFRRVIRVYSRDGELISCSEPIDGHESNLSWKPQGSLIASTQRRYDPEIEDDTLDIIFFEKNGLRHGEFNSRLDPSSTLIHSISWSSISEILAIQLDSSIQIWSTKNYHWYLKQEIYLSNRDQIKFMKFHPEKPFKLMIGGASSVEIIDMSYTTTHGSNSPPNDLGMTLVADGITCMITPFSIANVPPPVSYREFDIDEPIKDMAVSLNNQIFGLISADSIYFTQFDLKTQPKIVSKLDIFDIFPNGELRQISLIGNEFAYVLIDSNNQSLIIELNIKNLQSPIVSNEIKISPFKVISIEVNSTYDFLTYQTMDGGVHKLLPNNSSPEFIDQLPQVCNLFSVTNVESEDHEDRKAIIFGLAANGKLFANSMTISSNVTSMLLTDSHLLFTTSNELKFIHLNNNPNLFNTTSPDFQFNLSNSEHDERVRMIERGALLVSTMPSKSAVVLQATRGNLETFYPRIMVLGDVRKAISKKDYKSAFQTCRTHRISLDIIHDYNPSEFFNNIENFILQLDKVEYLDLFMSCLLEEDVCITKYNETNNDITTPLIDKMDKLKIKEIGEQKIRKICDSILEILMLEKYKGKYLQSIITAYACQKPPRAEEALELIGSFENDSEIEKSVQHLCFLLDVNKLYDQSLGIYNIPLALVVAQQSQKDPKEYLPFLQSLYEQTDLRKKVMVDTYLKKYSKALDSLILIPESEKGDIKDEIVDFIIDHELYKHALKLYRYDEQNFNLILKNYANYLHDKVKYVDAALAYEKLGMFEDALEDYITGNKWLEAISIALKPEFKEEKLQDTCEQLVSNLTYIHEYESAGYITYKYLGNIKESLELYCKDYYFSKAIEICMLEEKPEMIESIIDPLMGDGFGSIAELVADCKGQIDSQLRRLRELREKKLQDPYAFYGEADNGDTPDNVSIAPSETSTKESFFTRYTGKTSGTAQTGASRRTAKNKRREERKKARGKKGTVYEEEYLIQSVGRMIERIERTEPEALRLIEGLIRRSKMEQALLIQRNFNDLITLLKDNVVEIYTMDVKDRERVDERGIVYLIDEIPVPKIKDFESKDILDYF